MTSTLSGQVNALLEAAADAVTQGLTIGEPTTVTDLGDTDEFAAAITVPFTGGMTGEFAILVDAEVLDAVTRSGAVDVTAALGTAVGAVAAGLGGVVPGMAQAVDPRMALNRVAGLGEFGAVALRGASVARAAVVIGIEPAAAAAVPATNQHARLDLLRGVEMQASVELGRATMTVNELLSLASGSIIELDRAAGDPADLYVNGRLMARGEIVVVDENYAVRVTQIVTDESPR